MKKKHIVFLSFLGVTTVLYIFLIVLFEKHWGNNYKKELTSYNKILTPLVWSYDYKSPIEYLKIICHDSGYQSLKIINDGKNLISIENTLEGFWDQLFLKLKLIRAQELSAVLVYNNSEIGILKTTKFNQLIYIYLLIFALLFILWLLAALLLSYFERQTILRNTQQRLIETARQAGMAEVSISVLHNVGNVLNSVNVLTSILKGKIIKFKIPNVEKTFTLIKKNLNNLQQFIADDPKGKALPQYIDCLILEISSEHQFLIEKINELETNISHIKNIIARQQSYAKIVSAKEIFHLNDLIDDAVRISCFNLEQSNITFIKNISSDIPEICADKHKVLQIIINLLSNAKHAVMDSENKRIITIKAFTINDNTAEVTVMDTGTGITHENIERIFEFGFSTKKNGHGFGLHSSAIAAKELQGTLSVYSDGHGKGARFTLHLPLTT